MAKGNVLDKAGFATSGYIDKKGTPVAHGAEIGYIFNRLPPGQEIEDQETCDIRAQAFKELVSTSGYPGDGWSGATADPMGDIGPNMTGGGTAKEKG